MSRRHPPLLLVAAGYLAAVIVAVFVTVFLIFGTPFFQGETGATTPGELLSELPSILAMGFAWTFPCALPGFIVAIALGEKLRWKSWLPYAIAGFVNAAPALAIFATFIGSISDATGMIVSSFPGGFVGGTAYWFAAGRHVARRRAEPKAA